VVRDILRTSGKRHSILPKFGLDLDTFISDGSGSYARFVEVNSYNAARTGGVGFANNPGRGPQVDILLSPEGDIGVVDETVRWVLADATLGVGDKRSAFFDCSAARAAAMGGVAREKQNNLSISKLSKVFERGLN
jgi:hypothetical protein